MTAIKKKKEPRWPVVEVFGPTVQGEGVDQGVFCHFIRFGGCDYRCTWCDTPYAVLPAEVRANATRMSVDDIMARLAGLDKESETKVPWVILSGGNPALHDLQPLVDRLHENGFMVAVETQGSRWRNWMRDLDRVCVSPKPPSSKEPKARQNQLHNFLVEGFKAKVEKKRSYEWLFLKVVCFTPEDVEFAVTVRKQPGDFILFLSTGNDAGRTVGNPERDDPRGIDEVRRDLMDKTVWLFDEVQKHPDLVAADVAIQHQLHTGMWGNGQGF